MNADGIDLVLRRLSGMGFDPRPEGTDAWQAQCPVHGGPYPALLVSRGGDGSVSLKCRYLNHQGESCSEAAIWESLGLQPRQLSETPEAEPCGVVRAELREAQPVDRPEVPATAADAPAAVSTQQAQITIASQAPQRRARADGPAAERSGSTLGSHAEVLTSLARQVRVMRGLDQRFYAQVPVGGHQEVHELRSKSFQYWLMLNFRERQRPVPTADRIQSLIRTFEADAAALGSTETVWVRVGDGTRHGRTASLAEARGGPDARVISGSDAAAVYYLDLGDSSWQSVEIRAEGCRVVDSAPVLFRRPQGLGPLPAPQWDGSMGIDLLKKYANVTDADFPLLVGWMTAALRPAGPYPILILSGEQGSAKSTLARVARRLIDPNAAPLRGLPASQRDFMIQAHNAWVLAYDNIRSISRSLSDGFCRTATGGGFSTRSLHTNDDEALFDVERRIARGAPVLVV